MLLGHGIQRQYTRNSTRTFKRGYVNTNPIRIKLRKGGQNKMLMWHHEGNQNILHEPRSILMSSVTQVAQAMQTIFRQANAIARQTGFVQRESKLTGERFVQTLVTAWLNNP